jgi:hypothetical protein
MEYTCKHCGRRVHADNGELRWYGFKCDDCLFDEAEIRFNLRADRQEDDKRDKEYD